MIYMYSFLLILIVGSNLYLGRKRPETKGKSGQWFLPLSYFILSKYKPNKDKEIRRYERVYLLSYTQAAKKSKERILLRGASGFFLISIGLLFGMAMEYSQTSEPIKGYIQIERPEAQGIDETSHFLAKGKEDVWEFDVTVEPREYSSKEIENYFKKAKKYIAKEFLGKNKSVDEIRSNLNLVETIPNNPVTVSYQFEDNEYMSAQGELTKDPPKEGAVIILSIQYEYGKKVQIETQALCVLPKGLTKKEEELQAIRDYIVETLEKNKSDKRVDVPRMINGRMLYKNEEKPLFSGTIFCFIAVIGLLLLGKEKEQEKQLEITRNEDFQMEYPGFIQQFTLYIQAGLTVRGAFEQLCETYQNRINQSQKQYLYEEITITVNELNAGASEKKAYYALGKRIGKKEYIRLMTYLVQNLSKGNKGLLNILEKEVEMAFFQRKENARKKGEEAGTKLLLPMMLLLLVILLLVMVPAFVNFKL